MSESLEEVKVHPHIVHTLVTHVDLLTFACHVTEAEPVGGAQVRCHLPAQRRHDGLAGCGGQGLRSYIK